MDILLHGVLWLALAGAASWLLSFWPRWVADDLGMPPRVMLLRPWSRGLEPYRDRWPLVSLAFYLHLWRRGRILEFVLALIVFVSALRIASAVFKTAAVTARSA